MGDQNALQEAIQRAKQLAAKINQQPASQPIKRPVTTSDHSGPIKVTLAYEKPANFDATKRLNISPSRQRSTSRDYNRNDREREPRDYKDVRDSSYNRSPRESSRSYSNNMTNSMLPQHGHYENSAQPPSGRSGIGGTGMSGVGEDKCEIIIPHSVIGLVIGKGGENIKRIQNESGASVRVDPNTIDDKGNKLCTITGTKAAVEEARIQVENVIENSGSSKRPRLSNEGSDSYRMKIPASRTGAIIGKGGETIKSIKQQSGCDIELDKNAKECEPDESIFIIRGSQDKIAKARSLIEARLASRTREGPGRDTQSDNHYHSSSRSGQKGGVATGANAAPVNPGQFSEMPSTYPAVSAAAGQQNSADMTAAWAAYFAQYSSMFNQANAASMPYAAGPQGVMGSSAVATTAVAPVPSSQPVSQLEPQQPAVDAGSGGQTLQDYSDQWIEYYLQNGRPDYAEQIIQMKKQQHAQKQQQS